METPTPQLNLTPPPHHHRPDRGLTTLEWLLIVAAVAGLTALAVVLTQQVIDDTAEAIETSNARLTAAKLAAQQIEDDARIADAGDTRTATWARWEHYFTSRCRRLAITYTDINMQIDAAFTRPAGAPDEDRVDPAALTAAHKNNPNPTTAQIKCNIADTQTLSAGPLTNNPPTPPQVDLHAAQQEAAALEAEARTHRPGDTWTTWETHFTRRCALISNRYNNIRASAEFNAPTNKTPTDPTTQPLLNAATHTAPNTNKPQLHCTIQLIK